MAFPLARPQSTERARPFAAASPPTNVPRLLALWHLASLDAPTVAVVWTLAIAWTAGVRLDPWFSLLIACGTWTAYVGDRLLDARRAISSGDLARLRERHFFHWRYRRGLLAICVCTSAISAALVMRLMPLSVREHDSVIATAALAYFSGVHFQARFPAWLRRIASKEFFVGVLFTAGCAAPALSCLRSTRVEVSHLWPTLAGITYFAVLAWLNCAAIETWESGFNSSRIRGFAALICLIGMSIAAALFFTQNRASALISTGVASGLLLLRLDLKRHRFAPVTLRALADLVLLIPGLLLALGAHRG